MRESKREGRLSVLLADMQISFWFENKPFESTSLFTTLFDCSMIEGSYARTKKSLSDFAFL